MLANQWRDVGFELAVELGGEERQDRIAGQRGRRREDLVYAAELFEYLGARRAHSDVAANGFTLDDCRFAVDKSGENLRREMRRRIPHYSDDERAAGIVA